MSIRPRPVLTAVGIGVVIQIALSAFSTLTASLITPGRAAASPQWLAGGASALSSVACLCGLVIDVAVGLLYAYLHSREAPVTAGEGALGGAVSGAVGRLVSGLVGVLLSLLIVPALVAQTTSQIMPGGVPSDLGGLVLGASVVGGVIGAAFGICVALIEGGVLGAIGGVIGGAIFAPKAAAPTA
jgi:hypothetical protein